MFSDFCDCISSLTHLVSQGVNTACLSSGSFPIYQALIPPPRPQFLPKRYKVFSWSNPSTTSPFVLDAPLEALCLLLRSEHTFLRSWPSPSPLLLGSVSVLRFMTSPFQYTSWSSGVLCLLLSHLCEYSTETSQGRKDLFSPED